MKAIEQFTADFENIMKLSDDNLSNLRKDSFDEFTKSGLPTRKEELIKMQLKESQAQRIKYILKLNQTLPKELFFSHL